MCPRQYERWTTSRSSSRAAGGHHRSTTMVPSAAASTTSQEEATTTELKPQVDEEEIIIPRALQWIMAASSPSPPTLTIEEANRKSGMRRAGFWFCAVYILPVCIGVSSHLAYGLHRNDHIFPRSVPWRPPAVIAWGVYMALVMELSFFMSLFLPRAPAALRDAVVNVGVGWVGVPLSWIVILAACAGGHTWMCVVLAFVFAVLYTPVIALWVWLVRTYT